MKRNSKMSGVRRKTKYRKSVESDVLDSLPDVKEDEAIVRVVTSRGGNLVEVETATGLHALCRLPNRYRKVVWVKRGMLLIVGTCSEDFKTAGGEEGKVKFVVNSVVFTDDQMKYLRRTGQLPKIFDLKETKDVPKAALRSDILSESKSVSPLEDDSDDSDLPANSNRRQLCLSSEEEDDDDDDDDSNDDAEKAAETQGAEKAKGSTDEESEEEE